MVGWGGIAAKDKRNRFAALGRIMCRTGNGLSVSAHMTAGCRRSGRSRTRDGRLNAGLRTSGRVAEGGTTNQGAAWRWGCELGRHPPTEEWEKVRCMGCWIGFKAFSSKVLSGRGGWFLCLRGAWAEHMEASLRFSGSLYEVFWSRFLLEWRLGPRSTLPVAAARRDSLDILA